MGEFDVSAEMWRANGRSATHDDAAVQADPRPGSLAKLKATWQNADGFEGRMWNLIALPFGPAAQFPFQFRLLLNQGNERLRFSVADLGVANRGLDQHDQHLAALLYIQEIDQIMAIDAATDAAGAVASPATPDSNDTPKTGTLQPGPLVVPPGTVGIHREDGLVLRLGGKTGPCNDPDNPNGPNMARLASIPHGDSVLAMGFDGIAEPVDGAPDFQDPALLKLFDPTPIGIGDPAAAKGYLAPYEFFANHPFLGNQIAPFPGFNPLNPLALLARAIRPPNAVLRHTLLRFDTDAVGDMPVPGSITNIPFINCQAKPTKLTAFFWIQDVVIDGKPRMLLQYAQRVLLEFLPRVDGKPGRIQWPHITINSLIQMPEVAG